MQREFSLNIILLISINLLIKPFFIFGIDRTVQNVVEPEIYGTYATLLSFCYLLQIINDFGIQNFNSREISQHRQMISKYFPNILVLKTTLAIAFLTVVFVVGSLAGYTEHWNLLFFLALNQILVSLIFYFRSNLSGLGYYRIDSVLSALDKFLMVIFCSILLWVSPFRENFIIDWFIYGQTAALFLTAILTFFILMRKIPENNSKTKKVSYRFNLPLTLVLLKKSFPFALVILLMTIYTRIDIIMIDKLLPEGKFHASVYAAGYRLLDAGNMIGYLFASLLLPMFARMLKIGEPVGKLVQTGFKMIFAGSAALAVCVFFFKLEIVELLYVHATPYYGDVLGWLMFSFIAMTGTYIYGTLLTANGDLMKMNKIFAASIFINILLNFFLIPKMAATGAALATVITQTGVFLAQVFLSIKLVGLQYKPKMTAQTILYFFGCFAIAFFIKNQTEIAPLIQFVITFGTCLLLAILIKLLNFRQAFELIKSK